MKALNLLLNLYTLLPATVDISTVFLQQVFRIHFSFRKHSQAIFLWSESDESDLVHELEPKKMGIWFRRVDKT